MSNDYSYKNSCSRIRRPSLIDEYCLREGAKEAQKSKGIFRHATIVFNPKTGRIIARGYNTVRTRTHPADDMWSIHSEINALRQLRKAHKLKGLVLYNVQLRDGKFVNSMPCKNCARAIEKAGIRICYFTITED